MDVTANLLTEVSHDVCIEPGLQPISVTMNNEGSVGAASKGQLPIPMSAWNIATRAVVLIKRDSAYFNGSIVKFEDLSKRETIFGLLTKKTISDHDLDLGSFKQCEVFFNYDEGLSSKEGSFMKKSGQDLLRDDNVREDKTLDKTKVLDFIIFPLKEDALRDAFRLSEDKDIPYLLLDGGVDPKLHMVLYVIHHTSREHKKCMNSRFALPVTGPKMIHCVTTSHSSRGAPIFTAGHNQHGSFLRFIGIQLFDLEHSTKTLVLDSLHKLLGREKLVPIEDYPNVACNVAVKTTMIDKFLKGDLTDEDRRTHMIVTDALRPLYSKK